MTKHTKGLRAALREVSQSSERSTLFWWMVEHHRELKASSGGRRLRWEKLSAVFNELGLTDTNGNPAKPNTARQTWLRAWRFVAEEERQLAAARRPWATYPSRMPKNFCPAAIQNGNGLPENSVPARPPIADSPIKVMAAETPWGTCYKIKAYVADSSEQFAMITELTISGKDRLRKMGVIFAQAPYAEPAPR